MARREPRAVFLSLALLALTASISHATAERFSDVDAALRARDYERAATMLQAHAEAGDAEAQYRLATLYRSGRGVPAEPARAFEWMLRAATTGHADAAYSVAIMFERGIGVTADATEARRWVEAAAAAGHAMAHARLAAPELVERPASLAKRAEAPQSARPEPASVDTSGPYAGWPPLTIASWRGRIETVRELLAARADPHRVDPQGATALSRAVHEGHTEAAGLLLNMVVVPFITSGYRSFELNRAIGGAPNSDHIKGLAADFICPRFGPPAMVCQAIRDSRIEFRQLINEFNKWTHIAIPLSPDDLARQVMSTFTPGIYVPGLPVRA